MMNFRQEKMHAYTYLHTCLYTHIHTQEKCVDISLAVDMMHFATTTESYELCVLISGDKVSLILSLYCTFALAVDF